MKTTQNYNRTRRKHGGVKIATVLPDATEQTIYDDEVDPFYSPQKSPSEDEIMRANETKRSWVEQTKPQ